MRRVFLGVCASVLALVAVTALVWPPVLWSLVVIVPLMLRGVADMLQTRQAVRQNATRFA
jgi:uncharacterized membrane protein YdbT with pleckstrin-like domain